MERRDADRAAMLVDAGIELSSELSLERVLQRIVELAVHITGAKYAALGVLGQDGLITEFHTTGISAEQRAAIGHLPIGKGILGVLIHDARPLRLREISQDPHSVGFPRNHPPMHSFLGAPVKARGRVFGNLYLTEKQGAPEFDEEDERTIVALATQAGVAIENASLYEEARLRERRLEAVREISTAILEGADPEQVLELVATRAKELARADEATIAVPTAQEGELVISVAAGAHSDELRGTVFPMDRSISGEVIRTGKTVVALDASSDERAYQPIMRTGEIGAAMFVPLSARGSAFGTLAVGNLIGRRTFTDDDIATVETFANQASVALEYGRIRRELQRLAVMEDRERIGKELHDGVIQSLFAVGMGLQATATTSRDEEIGRRIDRAVIELDRVIRDLRNYIFGLRPGILADRQLDQAVRELTADFEQKTGVATVADIDPAVAAELSSSAPDVIQLVREALSNVGRHAEASTTRVRIAREDNTSAVIEIDDDGMGFDVDMAAGRGQGLANLEARAEALGGKLSITSARGEGTTVRLSLPL